MCSAETVPPFQDTQLAERFAQVQCNIAAAAHSAGRLANAVRLIAVSKTYPAELVIEAVTLGQLHFGESRVQEAIAKRAAVVAAMGDGAAAVVWHLIGHLQVNKAKFVGGVFDWVHSVDSLVLARKISAAARQAGRCCNLLIQVNEADDPNKHGLMAKDLDALVESLLKEDLGGIALRGLMTIGRSAASEQETRQLFAGLHNHCERVQRDFGLVNFNELSMGMSGDYQLAIAEGATMVRVGTALFGARTYAGE